MTDLTTGTADDVGDDVVAEVVAEVADLAAEFWAWRAATQPDSGDDITRIERPRGWQADWSPAAVADRRRRLEELTARHRALAPGLTGAPVPVQVDARLIGTALDRVRWELDVLRAWQRNPAFHLDQALVPVFNLLLPPPPFDAERAEAVLRQLRNVPAVLEHARGPLAEHAAAPFAAHALRLLAHAPDDLRRATAALAPYLPAAHAAGLPAATEAAATALTGFRDWLGSQTFTGEATVGREGLAFFLHRVALLPYGVEELRLLARHELARATAAEEIARLRVPAELPPPPPGLVARAAAAEEEVRRFYEQHGLLTQPPGLRHYVFAETPPYLEPLGWLGVLHDATSESRSGEDAVCYVREPGPDLPYFLRGKALDPRTGIAHEGVHAQQLALSWRHPDPVRRRFYDSAPNEGIAFYNEELMVQAGLFDDAPASRLFLANAMRLRALRVETDLALALGELTLEGAAERLAREVPLDEETAWEEAAFFAGNPGQALSYQTGKAQILSLLTAARPKDLRAFHDRLWLEGNVPLALQRWELLGLRDELDAADRLAPRQGRGELRDEPQRTAQPAKHR